MAPTVLPDEDMDHPGICAASSARVNSGKGYVSLKISAPELGPKKLYANLGRAGQDDEDVYAVIWSPAH